MTQNDANFKHLS